jgi:hypothetical protein
LRRSFDTGEAGGKRNGGVITFAGREGRERTSESERERVNERDRKRKRQREQEDSP